MSYSENWLESKLREIVTPDMVSLWIPSGQKGGIDLIGRNPKVQCFDTHPNVPVLPNLINSSVGWHFDGIDDYVDLGSPLLIGTGDFTMSAWIYRHAVDSASVILSNYATSNPGGVEFYVHLNNTLSCYIHTLVSTSITLTTGQWYYVAVTRSSGSIKLYVYGEEKGSGTLSASIVGDSNMTIGATLDPKNRFKGYIALPFLANQAWSIAQIKNFYNATKGMFAPRG